MTNVTTINNKNKRNKMNQEEIEIKVTEILINKLGISTAEVSIESNLKDLGADSLEQIEIILALEQEFGISIPGDIVMEDKDIKYLCRYIGDETLIKSVN